MRKTIQREQKARKKFNSNHFKWFCIGYNDKKGEIFNCLILTSLGFIREMKNMKNLNKQKTTRVTLT